MALEPGLSDESFCYLTTVGRVTGQPHEIEIWFALAGTALYMLAGGRERSDWVKNLRRTPRVAVRIGDRRFTGQAREVAAEDEDALARSLLLEKYRPGYDGDLAGWGRDALPIAVDLDMDAPGQGS